MRTNLFEYNYQVRELTKQRTAFKTQLQENVTPDIYRHIFHLVHTLNVEYYEHLKEIKTRKLNHLLAQRPASPQPESKVGRDVVTIPEDLPLNDSERSLLSKGLKFVPTNKQIDTFEVRRDLEAFYRKLKLHAHFNDPNKTLPSDENLLDTSGAADHPSSYKKFAPKSTWTPRDDPRDDIVIKPADKGGAIVVWRKDLYIQEVEKQLNDSEFYEPDEKDMTEENNQIVKECVEEEIRDKHLPPEATNLVNPCPKTSKFYVVPKIHKTNNPGRPIVSACSCPTERISALVDDVLRPLVLALPSYTRDSSDAITKVKNLHLPQGSNILLFTLDVKSLYTIIPHNDGLRALQHFLEKRIIKDPPTSTVLRLAELVLTLNSFEFNGDFFHQKKGVAMGTRMGPSYANLFMGFLEEKMESKFHGKSPELYSRYIDDIFGITTMPRPELDLWMDNLQSLHPSVEFTWEVSDEKIHFLDTTFTVKEGTISTSVYYKTTDAHMYLRYASFHPQKTKDAIPYGQMLRLRRLTSDDDTLAQNTEEMKAFFRQRDFPNAILQEAARKVSHKRKPSESSPQETWIVPREYHLCPNIIHLYTRFRKY